MIPQSSSFKDFPPPGPWLTRGHLFLVGKWHREIKIRQHPGQHPRDDGGFEIDFLFCHLRSHILPFFFLSWKVSEVGIPWLNERRKRILYVLAGTPTIFFFLVLSLKVVSRRRTWVQIKLGNECGEAVGEETEIGGGIASRSPFDVPRASLRHGPAKSPLSPPQPARHSGRRGERIESSLVVSRANACLRASCV